MDDVGSALGGGGKRELAVVSLGRVSSSGQMWVAHSLGIAPGGELGIGVVACGVVCDGGYLEAVLLWCWVVSSRSRRDQLQPHLPIGFCGWFYWLGFWIREGTGVWSELWQY